MQEKNPEFLSPAERAGLEDEKHDLERTLTELEGSGRGTQADNIDTARIRSEITRIGTAIDERTPGKIRATEKDNLVKEEKYLEEKISEGMPTWFEMRKPSMNPGAVRKHMAWCDRNKARIKRYKEIQRLLRPFDPKSIENLRKEK